MAYNVIKNYRVTVTATGSIKYPKITVDSVPALPQEQVLALLFTGTPEGTVQSIMPYVLLQLVEKILFSSAESSSDLQKYIQTLLQPLKNVRLTPQITNKPGEGLKAGLEIDVNGGILHARVQHPLTLAQAPEVQVEYTLSDTTTVRGGTDERGGLAAQVEMCWKF
jgi:hypothetical protein